ncbi:M56 family metallopeptidase [Rhodanobacter sp. DHG33]|uniref:M56 family metallopeptidase n=1 Tax=Rhodanobacter sp. DHG33 TaxID=2775921 RepID=UPI00177E0F40|nr:M56 family metallopeptidase [Rhodanobacter sp. DHG33]MBD8898055.1 peptidase M56 [Rhodanobacter sp. DHG33]
MSELQMPGLESLASAWAERGWLAGLAFTAAVLVVAALRRPARRWFGPERAFQLWLLPPLAMLVSQLPHTTATPARLPPLVYAITSAVAAPLPHAENTGSFDWRIGTLLLWLAGTVIVFASAVAVQRRYRRRLRGATPLPTSLRWPVLRAADASVGPALVGAWRSRIVLPADFAERYDATEQALILAHESAHARRGDGWWSLFAHALVALLWFHPLAWWALAALRRDQELACDAAVLRECGAQRRSYANAMLKTQSPALALPVGCAWSPRHPLTERIAMLKQKPVSTLRRRVGGVALSVFAGMAAGVAYAATVPAVVTADRYSLELSLSFDGKPAQQLKKMCLKPGEYASINGVATDVPPWQGRVAMFPAEKGEIEIRSEIHGGTLDKPVEPMVRTMPRQNATIEIGRDTAGADGSFKGIKLEMTPGIGC